MSQMYPLKQFRGFNCHFTSGMYDRVLRVLCLSFSLLYPFWISSTMCTLCEVVFSLNATCCLMSVHCWHFYSGSLTNTSQWMMVLHLYSCVLPPIWPSYCAATHPHGMLCVWIKRLWPLQIIKTYCEPVFMAHQTVQYRDHFPSHHTWYVKILL